MLDNILDNSGIGATIAHIQGANARAITNVVASFLNVLLGLTGVQIILARNVAKDWMVAGGYSTNVVPVAPNAGGGNSIVLAGVRSGQRLHQIKKHYLTTNKYVKMLEISVLKQGAYETVPSFWAKIQKYGDQLGYIPAQKKTYFLSRVRSDIRDEIYRIDQTKPINDIIDSLAELELRHEILQQASSQPHYAPIAPAIPNAISQQPVFPMADMQKMIQDVLAKQQAESDTKFEKLKAEFETKIIQQSKKSHPPVLSKDYEQIHEFYEGEGDPRWSNLSRKEALQLIDKAFPSSVPSKPERLHSSNQNARIDRIESKVGEIGQMTSQFGRMMLDNKSKKTYS